MFGTGYAGTLPEMQGLTDIQQRDMAQSYGNQRAGLARQYGGPGGGMQGSGAYYAGLSNLGAGESKGLSDIERQNMYQNAYLGYQQRQRQETEQFQSQMAQQEYQRQMAMMQQQRQWGQQDIMGNALGSLLGGGVSTGLGWLGAAAGLGMNPMQQRISGLVNNMGDSQLMNLFGVK